jgi:NAD(P)-dependent dehydrogenase (short-subunit alcohol dehydrogenase family)
MNTLDLFRLDGKTAMLTGGGRGLGRYMAEALSDAGANVVLCSCKIEPLEEVRQEIEARGGHALAVECDVGASFTFSLAYPPVPVPSHVPRTWLGEHDALPTARHMLQHDRLPAQPRRLVPTA